MNYLKLENRGQSAILTLDYDERRNSLSVSFLKEFALRLDEVESTDARVLIIRGNSGSEVWCAGFNIEELPRPGKDPVPFDHPLEVLLRRLQRVKIPVIAMMEGSVWGGGCDLAFTCDILIGTPLTSFAITPAKIGVPYNTSGILRVLSAVPPNVAKELFFTARPVTAERAFQLGILNHLVERDEIETFTFSLAERIAENSPLSISVIKRQINLVAGSRTLDSSKIEEIHQLREIAYNSNDYLEGIMAFKKKRKAKFRGE